MQKKKAEVSCAFCRGTGRSKGAVCPVCRGARTVFLSAPTRRCAYCRGSGLQQRGSALTCGVCGGVGTVEIPVNAVTCPGCGGSGLAANYLWPGSPLSCSRCGGRGVVVAEIRDQHNG